VWLAPSSSPGAPAYRRSLERDRWRAAVAARADYEHAAIMRGDAWRGTFGHYKPARWW
jgi:hypothetical protein